MVNLGVVEQFLNHIHRHQLCKTTDKILLAVSGGVDSMVMLDLFIKAGYEVGVVHCNFMLRGEESDGDEHMVKQVSEDLKIPFFSKRFETERLAEEHGMSIQVMARELRYRFFNETLSAYDYDLIATAHHVNDNLETIFLNLVRGTGFEGLAGIPMKNGNIIRPLLFASHSKLREHALSNDLRWREDSSNATDDYNRNFLRHLVIPRLKEINPSLEETFGVNVERISAGISLARKALHDIRSNLMTEEENRIAIDRKKLTVHEHPPVILWEMIKTHGFNYEQCKLIVKDHQPGKRFFSGNYRLTVDRDFFLLEKMEFPHFDSIMVQADQLFVSNGGKKLVFHYENIRNFKLKKDRQIAQLDADKVKFPLLWRPWKAGDILMPLGMKNEKKVSDLLIDAKVSLSDKERITVLESSNEIIWLVGIRIHEHYKVSNDTARVLIIEMN
jgi:tRNA(Ile)-lysidine synthase